MRFEQVSDATLAGVLTFANNQQTGSAGYATGGLSFEKWGVFFNNTGASGTGNAAPKDGEYAALTFIHEIGHALGLKHPHDKTSGEGGISNPPYLSTQEDITTYTQLSYTKNNEDYVSQFRDFDIAALQYLYGPAKVAGTAKNQTGDTVYTLLTTQRNFIWDGGGNDTLDASAADKRVVLSLEAGTDVNGKHSYFGTAPDQFITAAGQITINIGTVIENARGSAFDDVISGNAVANDIRGNGGNDLISGGAGDDWLLGGAGNDALNGEAGADKFYGGLGDDTLDGGDGIDVAYYSGEGFATGITVDMQAGTVTGGAGNDRLTSIERIWGTEKADTFYGAAAGDWFVGDAGNDYADGRAGTDYFQINNDISECTWTFDGDTCVVTTKSLGTDRLDNVESVVFVGKTTEFRTMAELKASAVSNRAPTFSSSSQSVSTNEDTAKAITLAATDADSDPLTYTAATAANGAVAVSGAVVTYTPKLNFNGTDSFVVTASDGKGGTTTQSINVTIAAVNDAPTFSASSQSVTATAGTAKIITLAATDVDGDTLTYTAATPGQGTATVSGSTLTYTPTSSASGTDNFIVTASDGKGGTATQTINATVAAGDDYPNSTSSSGVVTIGGTPTTGSIEVAGDADVFGVSLTAGRTYTFLLNSTSGSLDPYLRIYNSNAAELAYNDDFSNKNSQITYIATYGGSYYVQASGFGSSTGNYKIIAYADDYSALASELSPLITINGAAVIGSIENPIDIDAFKVILSSGTTYTFTISASSGLLDSFLGLYDSEFKLISVNDNYNSSNKDARITFTPTSSGTFYLGAESINSSTGNYSIAATGVAANSAPAFSTSSQSVTTNEDTAKTFTVNATDANSDTLTYSVSSAASGGTASVSGNIITYTPRLNYNGADSFVVTASDGKGGTATQSVNVTVAAVNDAPVMTSGASATVAENASISTVVYTAAATDVDTDDTKTFSLSGTDAALFNIDIANGAVTLKSSANYEAKSSYSINVVVTDKGGLTATKAVTVSVTNVNEAPTFSASSQSVSATAGTAKTITLAATDVDGDALTYTVATPGKGTATISGSTLTYTPTLSASGTDSFAVTARDPSGATATQTVNATIAATSSFRLTVTDGWTGSVGGNGLVFGTSGYQDITVLSGSVTFDASFNKGGDIIRFDNPASSYTVVRSGSSAQISAGSLLTATVPMGTIGIATSFADGIRKMAFSGGSFVVGAQAFSSPAATITAAPDGTTAPTGADNAAGARLSLSGGTLAPSQTAHVTISGKATIFGTSSNDIVALDAGKSVNLTFDASFNQGGDIIILDKDVGSYSAVRSGSSILLTATNETLSIPVGTTGLTLRFTDGDRTMLFAGGAFKIGDQTIGTAATALTPSVTFTSIDIGTASASETVSGAGAKVVFTDDATKNSFVKIVNFGSDDLIRVTGATSYNFTTGDLDGDGTADDLSISLSNAETGIINEIFVLNSVSPEAFIFDRASAVSAVGFNFITFG